MQIISAISSDLPAIAALHVESWRDAYATILPEVYLRDHVVKDLGGQWQQLNPADVVLCAYQAESLVGFAALRMGHTQGAFLENLHVRPGGRGHGVGAQLLSSCRRVAVAEGKDAMWLEVMARNTRARSFYARHGGRETEAFVEEFFGADIAMWKVVWSDL